MEPHLHGRQRAAAACGGTQKHCIVLFRLGLKQVQLIHPECRSAPLFSALSASAAFSPLTDHKQTTDNILPQPAPAHHRRRLPCRTWGRRRPRPGWRKTASSARTSPCPAWLRHLEQETRKSMGEPARPCGAELPLVLQLNKPSLTPCPAALLLLLWRGKWTCI